MFDIVIVGGGIAAVEAARYLIASKAPIKIGFVSGGHFVTAITSIDPISGTLFDFTLDAIDAKEHFNSQNITVFPQRAISISEQRTLTLDNGQVIEFERVLLCTGAAPRQPQFATSANIYTLRDGQSARELSDRVVQARRIVLVGDGGIGLELAHALGNVELIWCSKRDFGSKFLDEAAMAFMLESTPGKGKKETGVEYGCTEFDRNDTVVKTVTRQAALGPSWYKQKSVKLSGKGTEKKVQFRPNVIVSDVVDNDDNGIKVTLSTGEVIEADLAIFAIGVKPCCELVKGLDVDVDEEEGGIKVNTQMQSSKEWLYAAGDCCRVWQWPRDEVENWFQMRLWSQARVMGTYAAKCLLEVQLLDFSFMHFAHTTTFFGFRVILLGLFNGQGLSEDEDIEHLYRITKDDEYVKVILHRGKVRGATMISRESTGLEECIENLMANGLVLDDELKEQLLDPAIDIGDYFD